MRLEDALGVDADGGVEKRIEAAVAHQRVEHVAAAVGEDRQLAVAHRIQRRARVGIKVEMQIFIHDARESGIVAGQAEATQCIGQRVAGDRGEIGVAAHQRAQPAIFELLDAPDLRDDVAVAGKRFLGDGRDRLHVEQRAVCIENDGLDGHRLSPSRSSRRATCRCCLVSPTVSRTGWDGSRASVPLVLRRGFVTLAARLPEKQVDKGGA